jgi:hypothetical protein
LLAAGTLSNKIDELTELMQGNFALEVTNLNSCHQMELQVA